MALTPKSAAGANCGKSRHSVATPMVAFMRGGLIASCGHPSAGFRARTASLHAFVHLTQRCAVLGALTAHFGAGAAGELVQRRVSEHEIRGRAADFRAIHHQAEMILLD